MRRPSLAAIAILAAVSTAQAQEDFCQDPATSCARDLPGECLTRLGAGVLSAAEPGDACASALSIYRQCLVDVVAICGAEREAAPAVAPATGCSASMAREIFIEAKQDNNCLSYQAFLDVCPNAGMAGIARARMQGLGCADPEKRAALDRAVDEKDHAAAQRELKRLGFYTGGLDGDWGPKSKQALSEFERFAGVDADGVLTQSDLRVMKTTGAPDWAEVARVQALDFTRFTGSIVCEGEIGVLAADAKTADDVAEWTGERRRVVYVFDRGVFMHDFSSVQKKTEPKLFEFTAMQGRGVAGNSNEAAVASIDIVKGEARVAEDELFFQEATASRADGRNTITAGTCRVVDY